MLCRAAADQKILSLWCESSSLLADFKIIFKDRPDLDGLISGRPVIGSVFVGVQGILSRNIALESTRVAVVIGLVQLQILITLILGPIIQGKADREQVTGKLIVGMVLILGGTILIIYGRNM